MSTPNWWHSPVAAYPLLFPAAVVLAVVLVPVSAAQFSGLWSLPYPPDGLPVHVHEMLFGFVPAVIAGFLAHRVRRVHLWGLVALWLAARLSFWGLPLVWSAVLTTAFGVGLALVVIPPFWRAAKKWRNRLVVPVLLGIALAPGVFYGVAWMGDPAFQGPILAGLLLLMALLMLFMGGRMIAPAVAGYLQGQGITLQARVQPRLEALLLAALLRVALPFYPLALGLAALCWSGAFLCLGWSLWRMRAAGPGLSDNDCSG